MSRPQPSGQEYGYCVFEQLPNVCTVQNILHKVNKNITEMNASPAASAVDMKLNITQEKFH